MRMLFYLILLFFNLFYISAQASETIFYSLREHSDDRICTYEKTWASLVEHHKKLSLLIPQAFYIDEAKYQSVE